MKIQHTITTAALALAGLALAQPAAQAVSATAGDLILSFRYSDNSNTNDLEIDLGQSTNFTTSAVLNLTYGSSYYAGSNLGGLASSDLDATFGTSSGAWNALPLLVWDVAGHTGTTGTNTHLWATQTIGHSQAAGAGSTLTSPGGRIGSETNGFGTSAAAITLTSPEGYPVAQSLANQANYTGALRGSPSVPTDFGFFTNSTEIGVSSSANEVLELFTYGNNTVQDLGTFTLTPTGNFTFNGAASTPEPATIGLLGMAAAGFMGLRRRRATA